MSLELPVDIEANRQRYLAVRRELHAAFDHIALGHSCTVEALFQETRQRGLNDDDIRNILTLDELDTTTGHHTEMHFACYRSNAGRMYVARDTRAWNEQASGFEAFSRLLGVPGGPGRSATKPR